MSENTAAGRDSEDEGFPFEARRRSEQVLNQVVASPEIEESLGLAISEKDLRRQLEETVQKTLLGESTQEWLSTAQSLTAWRAAWLEAQSPPHLEESETVKDSWAIGALLFAAVLLVMAFAAAVVTLVVGYSAEAASGSLRSWPRWGLLGLWVVPVLAVIICVPLALLHSTLVRRRNRSKWAQKQLLAADRETVTGRAFDDDLYQALSAHARIAINAAKGKDDELRLLVKRWSGLNESYDNAYHIQTPAAEELAAHIAEVGSGSIGLAGPRGAGKTTLMRQYCSQAAGGACDTKNLAFMIPAPVAYVANDFLVLLFSELCSSYLILREGPDTFVQGRIPPPTLWKPPGLGYIRRTRSDPALDRPLLVRHARRHLTELQFMITYSATLSVTAAIPMVQPTASGGSSMAQHAMSYPELVNKFRRFLTEVAQEVYGQGGRVFIGIDEIDKIGSGQEAQQFVNELKVIFGIPHCFYLISVSEDALTSYELRGLPLRDAFDSAFATKILGVGGLDFSDAHALLAKRVVGLSEPYVWLCHCLSGGLPRDLIRSCVQIIRIGHQLGPDALIDRIAQVVITEELRDKANAMMRSWAGHAPNDDARELVYRIQNQTVTGLVDASGLHDLALWTRDHVSDSATAILGGYAYFCLTLLEVFGPALHVPTMQSQHAILETLASARKTFAGDAQLAWRKISEFRSAWHLDTIAQPRISDVSMGMTSNAGSGLAASTPDP